MAVHSDEQIRLYGETLADRFGRVISGYGISQRRLAATLGISPAMLSQLMSAHRTKIGNPVVYERLILLEQRAGEPDRARVLHEVRATQEGHTTSQMRALGRAAQHDVAVTLAAVIPLQELADAVAALSDTAPTLQVQLRRAVELAGDVDESRDHAT